MSIATITIIQPDGTRTVEQRSPLRQPSLEELQKAVGGPIEAVDLYLSEGTQAYANEEGHLLGLYPNMHGTRAVNWPYPIVGPVVICEGFDPEDD